MESFFFPWATVDPILQEGAIMAGYSQSDVKVETVGALNIPGENSITVQLQAKMAPSLKGAVKSCVQSAVTTELRKHDAPSGYQGWLSSVTSCEFTKVSDAGVVEEITIGLSITPANKIEEGGVDFIIGQPQVRGE